MSTFTIAYSKANEATARWIDQSLSRAGFQFLHLVGDEGQAEHHFSQALLDGNHPVLLLVSDNFLRDKRTMFKAYPTLQQLKRVNRFYPIILEGIYPGRSHGAVRTVPTSFDRLSDVIQYMNHWQEEYLELRKQKKTGAGDQDKVNEELKIVRTISTEIGELLRFLRGAKPITFDRFRDNHFEPLFRVAGKSDEEHQSYAQLPAIPYQPTVSLAKPKQVVKEAPKPIPQASKQGHEMEEMTELPDLPEGVRLSDIPGIKMVEEKLHDPEEQIDEVVVPPIKIKSKTEEHKPTVNKTEEQDIADKKKEYEMLQSVFDEEEEEELEQEPLIEEGEDDLFDEPEEDDEEEEEEINGLDSLIKKPKISVASALKEANTLFEQGERDRAIQLMATLAEDHSDDPQVRLNYSQALLRTSKSLEDVLPDLRKMYGEDLDKAEGLVEFAQTAEQSNNYDLALALYGKAEELDHFNGKLAYRQGLIAISHLEYQPAVAAEHFRRAMELDADNVDAHYRYGALLYEVLGQPDEAMQVLERTLRLDPKHPFAHYDLAILQYHRGNLNEAAAAYERAIQNNPELKTAENDRAFGLNPEEEYLPPPVQAQEAPNAPILPEQSAALVLITGATSGIGKQCAYRFAKAGHPLILTGRRAERLSLLKKELEETYEIVVKTLVFDVRDPKAVQDALNSLPSSWHQIDILINNAGLALGFAPVHESKLSDWETMIDTNIKGLLYMTRAITPHMVQRGSGHVINIGSIAGKEAYPNGNVYCATKFAVDGLTKGIRLDLVKHGIKVSQVAPAHVEETEFALTRFHGDQERAKIYDDFLPLTSRDVAETVFWIASQPAHVVIQDVVLSGAQQASATMIDRSGRSTDTKF